MKMTDDYLWDKTGEDPEIKNLEISLRAFRFQPNETPELKAPVLPFKKHSSRRASLAHLRALAAGVLIAFVLTGLWLALPNSQTETAVRHQPFDFGGQPDGFADLRQNNAIKDPAPVRDVTSANDDLISDEEKTVKTAAKNKVRTVRKLIYRPDARPQKIKKIRPAVKLTEEEKQAYEKLMLALSITSSKLKIVRDKVHNLDEQTAIYTENTTDTRKK